MRKLRTSGSVGGRAGNRSVYPTTIIGGAMTKLQFMQLGEVNDVRQYLGTVLEKRGRPDDLWVFRGQRERIWDPTPQIDRTDFVAYRQEIGWDRPKHEAFLLNEFKRAARPLAPTPPQNDWEWLALAQHHGLATRLLDWTTNSLGALFFACEEQHSSADSVVWCYHHEGKAANPSENPFDSTFVTSYWPPHVTQRITVQGGCFTSHSAPTKRPLLKWPGDLRQLVIPAASRHRMRRELAQLGIVKSTLFPDLDGIAATINHRASMDKAFQPSAPIRKPASRRPRSSEA